MENSDVIKENLLDISKLRACMDYFKKDYRADQKRVEWRLMRLENKQKEVEKQKRRLIDGYAARQMTQEEYVNKNVDLDQELLKLKARREDLFRMVPLMNKRNVVEVSIRQFCDNAKVRLEKCHDFDSKRQFLLDHIEKVVYGKDKITIHGAVHLRVSDKSNTYISTENKIQFVIEDIFDKKLFKKKTREQYLVDGRLREWGSGGRHAEDYKARMEELQLPAIKSSHITQKTVKRDLRDGYMSYTAKSYLEKQKIWNENRKALIANILKSSRPTAEN